MYRCKNSNNNIWRSFLITIAIINVRIYLLDSMLLLKLMTGILICGHPYNNTHRKIFMYLKINLLLIVTNIINNEIYSRFSNKKNTQMRKR